MIVKRVECSGGDCIPRLPLVYVGPFTFLERVNYAVSVPRLIVSCICFPIQHCVFRLYIRLDAGLGVVVIFGIR